MPDAESAFSAIASDWFDLVLSEIVMSGVDGLQLLIRICNCYPHARLVMMTGTHHDSKIRDGAFLLGACDFLTQPFSQEELLTVIRNALEGEAALELQT
ncbi:MAG: response regulator [Longimicrobiales bacterium]|jgi:DNA-binding NtrC family response regulator|nr:response regulator [Longimicrobiales bacterium]